MDSPYAKELRTAFAVIRQAAKLSQAVISAEDKGVIEKDDLSPVTVADFAIQALLTATIHGAFPNDRFVGEETSADLRANPVLLERVWALLRRLDDDVAQGSCKIPESPDQACEMIDWCGSGVPGGPESGRVWVFDPIDGTKTFVQGQAYAINVALLEGGKQVLSAVGCPTLPADPQGHFSNDTVDPTGRGSLISAVRGYGTFVRPLFGSPEELEGHRIQPQPDTASLAGLRGVTCFKTLASGVDDCHELIMTKLGIEFPGSDLLGWVPRWVTLGLGVANVTVWVYKKRERHGKLWDHAGAMLLFEEVGGKITDIDGKDIDLTVGRIMSANCGFVAAPKNVHSEVLKAVQETLKEQNKSHLLAAP
ncbi:3'-5'-bisphosphate nucleotidase [Apiospora arundinis]|uniref:Carbohydrate phosphatase n=1 Tax=Apiospora arundinis TaxID=335852 RepID=A0ABR2IVH9_9PEZI